MQQKIPSIFANFMKIPINARRVVFCSGLRNLAFGFFNILQGIYLEKIGIDLGVIAGLLSFQLAVAVIFAIPSAILSDRGNRRLFYMVGTILNALGILLYVLSTQILLLVLAGIAFGIGDSLLIPPENALISLYSESSGMTEAFSLSASIQLLLSTIGTLMAMLPDIFQIGFDYSVQLAYHPLFIMGIIIIISGIIFVLPLPKVKKESTPKKGETFKSFRKISRTLSKFALYQFLMGFGAGFIIPLFPLWFYLQFGIGGIALAPMYTASNLLMSFFVLAVPKIKKKMGAVRTIAIFQGTATFLLFVIPFLANFVAVVCLFVIRTLLMNIPGPIVFSMMMANIPDEQRGFAVSIASAPFGIVWGLPNSTSQGLGGQLLDMKQYTTPFLICGSLFVLAIFSFYLFFGRGKVKEYEKST
jgi:MFS family permease